MKKRKIADIEIAWRPRTASTGIERCTCGHKLELNENCIASVFTGQIIGCSNCIVEIEP